MARITINDLQVPRTVNPDEAAKVKGGPLEIRELTIKATIAPDTTTGDK